MDRVDVGKRESIACLLKAHAFPSVRARTHSGVNTLHENYSLLFFEEHGPEFNLG